LDAIPVVEFSHFDALKQLTNADWVPQTMQSKAYPLPDGQFVLKQSAFMMNGRAENYITASIPASSFETDRSRFLGDHEYNSWANPGGLREEDLPCSEALNGDNIGALLLPLGKIEPGGSAEFIIQVGQVPNVLNELDAIQRWFDLKQFRIAQEEISRYWQQYLSKIRVDTPDDALNSMLNIHNPRQCQTTRTWSRYLSLYQLGYGSRGIGVRDTAQDIMAVFASSPTEGKALLTNLLSVQRPDGSAYHQYFPLTLQASEGDSLEYDDRPHYYCDDHLWCVLAASQYIKETGDRAFLREVLPYYETKKRPEDREQETVLDHLIRALKFTRNDLGEHGLPHLGFADWNDTINLPTGSESMLAACLYGKALLEMIDLLTWLDQPDQASMLSTWYQDMKASFLKSAWDGEWFRSYFNSDGTPMGSKANEAGKIIAYGQAWPVIANFSEETQSKTALDSLKKMLNTTNGIKLSTPGFNQYDREKGGITTYPPGAKENGGIFLHVNPWVVIAETILGRGDLAYTYYSQINPALKNDLLDRYQVEPYVFAQNILGDEHPLFGMGRNSWLSGTASWMYQAGTQYILGIRPELRGLKIDPCIPADWESFSMERWFRGTLYEIEVTNPYHRCKGIKHLRVDGIETDGNLVPVFEVGTKHQVRAILG
jgi:cellobiose phosphorylase